MKDKRISVIGCGRAGSKLGFQLARSGYRIEALYDIKAGQASKLGEMAGCGRICRNAAEAASFGDIIFIATPDSIIEKICHEIASAGEEGFRKNSIVFHLSGSLESSILSDASGKGAFTASFHPLQSLAGDDTEINPFKGILVAVEGCREAVEAAEKIASDLGAEPYEIHGNSKMLYHASAVIASNYLVSLMKVASEVMAASGIPEEKAFEFLLPLVKGTVLNMEIMGVEKALTGPVARGDAETVAAHIAAIEQKIPELEKIYIELGRTAVRIAEKQKFLSEIKAGQMKEIFRVS